MRMAHHRRGIVQEPMSWHEASNRVTQAGRNAGLSAWTKATWGEAAQLLDAAGPRSTGPMAETHSRFLAASTDVMRRPHAEPGAAASRARVSAVHAAGAQRGPRREAAEPECAVAAGPLAPDRGP